MLGTITACHAAEMLSELNSPVVCSEPLSFNIRPSYASSCRRDTMYTVR